MTSHRDDDALGWAGDDDPTLASGPRPVEPGQESVQEPGFGPGQDLAQEPGREHGPAVVGGEREPEPTTEIPDGWSVVGPTTAVQEEAARNVTPPASSIMLITLGILAGVYLLYTIGWFIGIGRIANSLVDPVAQFMFALGLWLAVAAPAVWFGATFWLTGARPRTRIAWLLAGAVLLAPLPFVLGTGGIS